MISRLGPRTLYFLVLWLAAVMLPVGIGSWTADRAEATLEWVTAGARLAFARTLAADIQRNLDLAIGSVRAAARDPGLAPTVEKAGPTGEELLVQRGPDPCLFCRAVGVFDPSGKPIGRFTGRPGLASTIASVEASTAISAAPGKDAALLVREPIRDAAESVRGFVVAEVPVQELASEVPRTRFGDTGHVTLIEREGRVLVTSDPSRERKQLVAPEILELTRQDQDGTAKYFAPVMGRREFTALAHLPRQNWAVMISQAEAEAFSPGRQLRLGVTLVILALILAGGVMVATVFRDFALYEQSIWASGARLAEANTERRQLQERMLQSQKIEAIGRLAGGIAHDFNNLLGVITGLTDLLHRDLGRHPALGRVEQIRDATDRAAALTRQLLAFSRRQILQPKVLDLNAVLRELETMLRRVIGEDIEFVTAFASGLGRVKADPAQLEQVIMNLAVNARDAMLTGGKLILETANVDLDATYVRSHAGARAGPYVLVAVSDTGHGMDSETLSHVFEPFFTTKEPGQGTGLGLATVYGIVKQSGGYITVYSERGRGSTFKIYLPRVDEEAEPRTMVPPRATPAGSETILLVEDEASLRSIILEILQGAGYTVLESESAERALSLADKADYAVHLMLTDVVMPRMSGPETVAHFRRFRPGIKVLFMSGYTDEAIGHHGVLEPGTHFIQKPFTSEALLHKVREVLDAPAPPRGG